ncbi:MAG: hypothetical protein AB7O97_07955 [Planctomycetota bacterium]
MMRLRLVLLPLLVAACSSAPAAPAVDGDAFLALGIAHSFVAPLPHTFCSGQMTPEQFDALGKLGIARVISLRGKGESGTGWEEQRARQLGIEFVRIEVGGADDLTDANVERLGAALAPQRPTLVACGSSNRVGALLALKAWRDGSTPEQALALGKQCGMTRLEPAVRARLGLE